MKMTLNAWRACLLLVLLMLGGTARAGLTVTSIKVNGATSATVAAGASIDIEVIVAISSARWNMVLITTSPASSLSYCVAVPGAPSGNTSYTRVFTVPAPSTQGAFNVRVTAYPNPNCSAQPSPTATMAGTLTTGPSTLTLNHVRIKHDGAGLTCSPEPVTLQACANATCSTLYTGNVTVSLGTTAGAWSSTPVTFANGSTTVNLNNTIAGTSTLSGTVTSPVIASSAAVCYNGSTSGNCALIFSNASCSLDAVEAGQAPNTPIYTKRIGGTLSLNLLALNNGVINAASSASITAKLVTGSATGCSTPDLSNPVTITVGAGRGTATFVPFKAARNVRVLLTSGSVTGCSSDNFAIRPASLALSVTGVNADASGTSASATPVLKAGITTFTMNAAAATDGYDGTPTINANSMQTLNTYIGTLAGGFGPANPAGGTATGNAFTYSEVGYFRLGSYGVYDDVFADIDEAKSPADCMVADLGSATAPADPNLMAADGKIGCYFGNAAATTYFGRFIPDRFVLSAGAIVNRSAMVPACTSTFSYLGEPLTATFTLTAVNGAGDTTGNYAGTSFARLAPASQLGMGAINDPVSGTRTPFPVCITGSEVHPCITPGTASGTFADGASTNMMAPLTVFRGATAVGPFADFKLAFAPVDSDGVKIGTFDLDTVNASPGTANHALAAGTILRYGRMGIDNAYGSELLNLTMKLRAQYWNGSAYVTNSQDSCTAPAFQAFVSATDYRGGINATNMPSTKLVTGPALVSGTGQLMLTKPGPPVPTSKGSVTVKSAVTYLPGSARATFGVYKAGPVIYVRETY